MARKSPLLHQGIEPNTYHIGGGCYTSLPPAFLVFARPLSLDPQLYTNPEAVHPVLTVRVGVKLFLEQAFSPLFLYDLWQQNS